MAPESFVRGALEHVEEAVRERATPRSARGSLAELAAAGQAFKAEFVQLLEEVQAAGGDRIQISESGAVAIPCDVVMRNEARSRRFAYHAPDAAVALSAGGVAHLDRGSFGTSPAAAVGYGRGPDGALLGRCMVGVMSSRATVERAAPAASSCSFPSGLIQRRCACGGVPRREALCEPCRAKRTSSKRALADRTRPAAVSLAERMSSSPGQPLDADTRSSMERGFGHDFCRVRVHTDARAAESARALSAEAFTVGSDVYFARDRYAPHSSSGRRLLGHELAHVVQQAAAPDSRSAEIDEDPRSEAEAERAGHEVAEGHGVEVAAVTRSTKAPAIQRRVVVHDPAGTPAGAPPGETNEAIARDYVTTLCSDFTVTGGVAAPTARGYCPAGPPASSTPEACGCLCAMHTLQDPGTGAAITWTIDVKDDDWPHTDPATRTVTVHSPYSSVQFGAWSAGPGSHRTMEPNWLVLGHELCGHARLVEEGTHPAGPPPTHGGRPSHDVTVQIENAIAAEHGIPASELRGLFADPHHGESTARVTVAEFPTNSSDVAALPPIARRSLDIAEAFNKSAPVRMDVIGHTDQTGPTAANATISRRRAQSVKAELERRSIASGRFLSVTGAGSAECPTGGNQPACRKVELFMFIMEGGSVTHP